MKYLSLILFLFSNVSLADTVQIKGTPFVELNSLLGLDYSPPPKSKASGYYNISGKRLDGYFSVLSHDTGKSGVNDYNYEFMDSVKGQHAKGIKIGKWVYDHIFDDAIDFYAKYTIELYFNDGKCIKSIFNGSIGHIMPQTKHTFRSPDLCSPGKVSARAWELWGIEYNKQKEKNKNAP